MKKDRITYNESNKIKSDAKREGANIDEPFGICVRVTLWFKAKRSAKSALYRHWFLSARHQALAIKKQLQHK